MKVKVGDVVRYLNEVGGGRVCRIIDSKLVEIQDDDGFEVPVLANELVVVESAVEPVQNTITPNVIMPEQEPTIIEGNDKPSFYIAFVPNNLKKNYFDFYIINDSNLYATYVCANNSLESAILIEQGVVEPNSKIFVKQFSIDDINELESINVQLLLFSRSHYKLSTPIEIDYKVPQTKFYKEGSFHENDFFDENAIVFTMFEQNEDIKSLSVDDIEKVKQIKDFGEKKKRVRISPAVDVKETREVDLHIHEIIDDESGLDAAAKLDLQLQEFQIQLSKAIQDGISKIVFIHGVGTGVLKSKIISILNNDYSHLMYQDASFQKYKFGATLIYLKKFKR